MRKKVLILYLFFFVLTITNAKDYSPNKEFSLFKLENKKLIRHGTVLCSKIYIYEDKKIQNYYYKVDAVCINNNNEKIEYNGYYIDKDTYVEIINSIQLVDTPDLKKKKISFYDFINMILSHNEDKNEAY